MLCQLSNESIGSRDEDRSNDPGKNINKLVNSPLLAELASSQTSPIRPFTEHTYVRAIIRPDLFFALFAATLPAVLCAPSPISRTSFLGGASQLGAGSHAGDDVYVLVSLLCTAPP